MSSIALLSAASTGAGVASTLPGGPGKFEVYAWGTFGGATVKLEASPDNGTTWIDVASFTANGRSIVEVAAPLIRGEVVGGTAPSVSLKLFR